MTVKNLHVIGVDPGGTTGWCLLTVPIDTVFGNEQGHIIEWDYGQFMGRESDQAFQLARLARTIQSLDYKTGPALVVEDFDNATDVQDPRVFSPVRIAAMLTYQREQTTLLADSTVTLQSRGLAKGGATDERLKAWGLYIPGPDHMRDAARHAITALRRTSRNKEFARTLWPHA